MTEDSFEESARLIIEALRLILQTDPSRTEAPVAEIDHGCDVEPIPLDICGCHAHSHCRAPSQARPIDDVDLMSEFARLTPDQMKCVLDAVPIIQRLRAGHGSRRAYASGAHHHETHY